MFKLYIEGIKNILSFEANGYSVEKVGRIGEGGYPGVKYSYNKGQNGNRAIRSIELHSRHNGHGIHLQGNKWNLRTGTRSGVSFRRTLWR